MSYYCTTPPPPKLFQPIQYTAQQTQTTFVHRKSFHKEHHNYNCRESYQSKSITKIKPMYRPYPNSNELKLKDQDYHRNIHSTGYQGEEQNFEAEEENRLTAMLIESPPIIQENFSKSYVSSDNSISISKSSSDEFFDWAEISQISTSDLVPIEFDDFWLKRDDLCMALEDKEDSSSERQQPTHRKDNDKEVSADELKIFLTYSLSVLISLKYIFYFCHYD